MPPNDANIGWVVGWLWAQDEPSAPAPACARGGASVRRRRRRRRRRRPGVPAVPVVGRRAAPRPGLHQAPAAGGAPGAAGEGRGAAQAPRAGKRGEPGSR